MSGEVAAELVRLRAALAFYCPPWTDQQAVDGGQTALAAMTAHLARPDVLSPAPEENPCTDLPPSS